jgi:exonuclease III
MCKLSYIEKFLNSNRLDVLVLQETKIDDVIPNNLLRFTNYDMIRRDRTKSGGGILVYFRSIYVVSKLISDQIYETISFNLQASGK